MAIINLGDPNLEISDPTPDIHVMFVIFDDEFFYGKLKACQVGWSKRMTTCAGICYFRPSEGYCRIGLSEPLLKLRSRKELVETLLHEMIHAYLFVTSRNQDRDGHGPEFRHHMERINKVANANITVYHSFHAEVNHYKQHWWRCSGKCRNEKPYYGWVKRAMNRAPGKNDTWWAAHQATCGGVFEKVREPEKLKTTEDTRSPKKIKSSNVVDPAQKRIDSFFKGKGSTLGSIKDKNEKENDEAPNDIRFPGKGHTLGAVIRNPENKTGAKILSRDIPSTSKSGNIPMIKAQEPSTSSKTTFSRKIITIDDSGSDSNEYNEQLENVVDCPSCYRRVPFSLINSHLDECAS